jgi:ATPase family associated with various cellular activities (AAA)
MTQDTSRLSWSEANHAYLVEQFARLERLLHPGERTADFEDRPAPSEPSSSSSSAAIDRLTEMFGLSPFERELVLLCAGVEMDSRLAARCADAQGHPQKSYASFGLAMSTLPEAHWSALTPARPLRRYRMIEVQSGGTLTSAPLRIDERILHYLAGVNVLDPRLQPLLRLAATPGWLAESHREIAAQATAFEQSYAQALPIIHLCGDDLQAHEDVAAISAEQVGAQLFCVRNEDLPAVGPDLDQFAMLWQRESLLLGGGLLLQCGPAGLSRAGSHLLESLAGLVFLSSRDSVRLNRSFLRLEVNKPGPAEQKQLWTKALGPAAESHTATLDDISQQFRLSARTIFSTAFLFAGQNHFESGRLWDVCRSLARPKLEDLAQRIVPVAEWDDLILPEEQKLVLGQLASQVRHRMKVYESWGFSSKGHRGLGVSALFTGASGTGKTMAAEVLSRDLRLDLYRVDLASVVSKYIGETEKNLKQVFDAAEEGGVLLLFDEADALFGKRGEVRDSQDRYANIEVGYLLQRMEAYQGLAILTTNLKASLDPAFQRRLRFTVNFPFPDAAQREAIWSRVFPAATPTQSLDTRKLSQLNVSGGSIRNIALNAAFLAAEVGTPVEMSHLIQAARLEVPKMERSLSEAEIRGWV